MIILALDPGASTGYCLANSDTGEIYKYGFIDIDESVNDIGHRCVRVMEAVSLLIDRYSAEHVVVEDYFFGSKFSSGVSVNTAYRAAIYIQCCKENILYTIINPSEWKKFIAGRSTPDKIQKKKWGKEAAKKLFIQEALWQKYNIRFPNHSLSSKTGKPIVFRYDIVDVVGQMIFYLKNCLQLDKISVTMPVPADVQLRRETKKNFSY
jgi:Holliday junction resolvasome RuvABC endonuclease subunit